MKYFAGGLATIVTIIGLFWLFSGNAQKNDSNLASSLSNPRAINYKQLKVGTKAPDFNLMTVNGQNLSLDNLQGKIIVLTSSAAWCPTCVIENKNFQPVYNEVKDKGVEFITVDIDPIDDATAIKEFQKRYAPWHNVEQKQAKKLIKDYGFSRFEITYIINRNGIIKFRDSQITKTGTLREELAKLI